MSTNKMLEVDEIDGVGPAIATKLLQAGYSTVQAVASAPLKELLEKTKLGDEAAKKIVRAARVMMHYDQLTTGLDIYQRRKEAEKLTTGVKALDAILQGGIETQSMTELCGEYATGKSQVCLLLSVMAHLPREKGGLGGKAVFIDTEGTFRPERVYQIAQQRGLDPEAALSNIYYARAMTSDHQTNLVETLGDLVVKENVRLVIVDSIISHFRSEYLGRECLSERQQKLNRHLHMLLRLAEMYNLAVVLTNQTQANPQAFFGDPNRPAGGNVLSHGTTHRLYLRKRAGARVATIMDSPSLPPNEAMFQITTKGIEDVDETQRKRIKATEADPEQD